MGKALPEAIAISRQYLDSLPDNYAARYSELGDADTLTSLLSAIRSGLRDAPACEIAGIDPRTLQRWVARAKADPDSPYAAFVTVLTRVREERKKALLERIERHGETDWRADAWLLERTDPAFALQNQQANTGLTIIVGGDAKMLFAQPRGETLSPPAEVRVLSPPLADDLHRLSAER